MIERREYTDEYRREIADYVISCGCLISQMADELGIKGCTPYKSKRITIPNRSARPKFDLIERDFTSPVPTYKLVGDITYLKTVEDWLISLL